MTEPARINTALHRGARHKKLPRVLTREEVEGIKGRPNVRYPTGLRNRAMLELMHRTGLRCAEVVNLRRGNIVWDSGMIEVRGGKGGRDRAVPADKATVAWLQAWDGRRARGRTFFDTLKGGPLSTRYVREMVKRLARKAGLEEWRTVSPHAFRHTYATELLQEGFTIREVQDLLGHANVATTEIYTHVRPEALAEKIQARERHDV